MFSRDLEKNNKKKGFKATCYKGYTPNHKSLWIMQQKPEIKSQQLELLQDIFSEDLAILGSWLAIEISCENFTTSVKNSQPD